MAAGTLKEEPVGRIAVLFSEAFSSHFLGVILHLLEVKTTSLSFFFHLNFRLDHRVKLKIKVKLLHKNIRTHSYSCRSFVFLSMVLGQVHHNHCEELRHHLDNE